MKIAFVWQGFDGRYGQWKDGLYAAMKLLEQDHEVRYFDFPLTGIHEFNPDVVLYWEAPCTLNGKNAPNYMEVLDLPFKKALLFAGGPIRPDICFGFDLYFVESRINELEFEDLGLPWKRAFGVNTDIMKPQKQPKVFNGLLQATFAAWKRHNLFANALGTGGVACGRKQDHEPFCYEVCEQKGVLVLPELQAEAVCSLINASYCIVNTSDVWGGGQRCTLEAMACGVPVVVMSDSPKNCEFVTESAGGVIVDPTPEAIQNAIITKIKGNPRLGEAAYTYVENNWTHYHYRDALMEGILSIL